MTPDAREELRRLLIADEGIVLHAYQDQFGYWTIGVGHLIDKRKGGGISNARALDLLEDDIDKATTELTERFPWFVELDPVRQVVLLSLCFNMGIGGLAKFVRTLAAVESGDYAAAAEGLKASLWYKQVQPSRSDRLIAMMRTGQFIHKESA